MKPPLTRLSPLLEIIGKSQPTCSFYWAERFIRFFPANLCLLQEPVRIVNVHGHSHDARRLESPVISKKYFERNLRPPANILPQIGKEWQP
jgi:hypothetical protein